MKNWRLPAWALFGLLSVAQAGPAHAQGGGVNASARPKFSPYLNLTRPGTDPALNYYGLVRPQLNFYNAIQQLEQRQTVLADRQQEATAASVLPPTGHATGFLNHTRYFLTGGGATPGGGRFSAAPAVGRRMPAPRGSATRSAVR